jgi:hypothetical protein
MIRSRHGRSVLTNQTGLILPAPMTRATRTRSESGLYDMRPVMRTGYMMTTILCQEGKALGYKRGVDRGPIYFVSEKSVLLKIIPPAEKGRGGA